MRKLLFALLGLTAAAVAGYKLVLQPWWQSWGVDADESARTLPGDYLLPDAATSDTRGITLDAPPEAVWPWLVQMGYGRAGWYSYDMMDMSGSSATEIHPDWQSLKVGDLMPAAPGAGFEVKVLEPHHALVVYADNEMMKRQADEARASGTDGETPANLKATGMFMENAQPTEFAVSWAFVLEPMDGGRTRLVERLRARFGESDKPWTRVSMPAMGFGIFVMMRRQMLGIRDRVEGTRSAPTPAAPTPSAPTPDAPPAEVPPDPSEAHA